MSHPQFQFVDKREQTGQYVCQFADSCDPRIIWRFAQMSLTALEPEAIDFIHWRYRDYDVPHSALTEQLARIRDLFERIRERERILTAANEGTL